MTTAEISEKMPSGLKDSALNNVPSASIASHAGLVSLSTAGNAATLRVRQSTIAHTCNANRPKNRIRSV